MKRIVSLIAGVLFLVSMAGFAANGPAKSRDSKSSKSSSVTHQATGTITSVDANNLVISHKVKGKEEQSTFAMNDQTKKQGDLKTGERATVHYRSENGQNVATVVKVSGPMARAGKK
jgi:hypothetical protein